MSKAVILIPARLASRRLPNKPLAEINGEAMIIHIARLARRWGRAPVVIAAGDEVIVDIVKKAGFQAVLTDSGLPSGSDRCVAALEQLEADTRFDIIINLQGDMPNLSPQAIEKCYQALTKSKADCATLVHRCDEAQKHNRDQVKAVLADSQTDYFRVLYFSRSLVPSGQGDIWGHIGIYAWQREALLKFSQTPPSPLEQRENLEQLRALENNMTIVAAITDRPPLSVDSPADLEKARSLMRLRK